jgi:hypothetical protein
MICKMRVYIEDGNMLVDRPVPAKGAFRSRAQEAAQCHLLFVVLHRRSEATKPIKSIHSFVLNDPELSNDHRKPFITHDLALTCLSYTPVRRWLTQLIRWLFSQHDACHIPHNPLQRAVVSCSPQRIMQHDIAHNAGEAKD